MSDHYAELESITLNGLRFAVRLHFDAGTGRPWEESDGHGPVRTSRTDGWGRWNSKRAGEVVLSSDRFTCWLYDVAEALRIAKRDGWGLSPEARAKLADKLKREPTAAEVRAEAVRLDMERLRGWLEDRWHWCIVVVTLLDTDGDTTWEYDCLGGIESDAGEYLDEVAADLAAGIADRVGQDTHILMGAKSIRIRPEALEA
jgi:hypothetical protein